MHGRRPKPIKRSEAAKASSKAPSAATDIYATSHRTVSAIPEGTRTAVLRHCRIVEGLELPQSLVRITLAACHLKDVPPALLTLKNLQTVHLPGNDIRVLPSTLPTAWKHVVDISLDGNLLADLSPVLALPHLRRLSACRNNVAALPEALPRSLVELRLDGNRIAELPPALASLPLLRIVTVDDNDIADLSALAGVDPAGADTAKVMLSAQRNRRPLPADVVKSVILSEKDARASVKEVLRRRAFVASTKLDW